MAESLTATTRLRVVRDVQEDESGANVNFQDGGRARLAQHVSAYAIYLRLARRSHERQHPVGVSIGGGELIADLVRADNDIPLELTHESAGASRVLFQGHDGVFHLKPDRADVARIEAVLTEAIRARAAVWFIVDKPDLTLLDMASVAKACSFPNRNAGMSDNGETRVEPTS
jgi:hypothetical protein